MSYNIVESTPRIIDARPSLREKCVEPNQFYDMVDIVLDWSLRRMSLSNVKTNTARSSRVVCCTALAVSLFACAVVASGQEEESISVTVLDVGQADAILIRAPEGQTALVDAGRSSPVRFLQQLGVDQIDLLVATHPHADHIGGMEDVINSIPVTFYMDNGQPHTTATYRNLVRTLQQRTDITYLTAEPRTIRLGSAEIEVLPLLPANSTDFNNRSVGLVLRYGSFVAFLSGDSETRELTFWVRQGVVPNVTVLKAPHHGSDNGFTQEFLQAAKPNLVVISVGRNSYGHPRPEAVQAYSSVAQRVLRTDRDGQVTIRGYRDGRYELQRGQGSASTRVTTETTPTPEVVRISSPTGLSVEVFADAPGNDHQNRNGEYAVLRSTLSNSVDIGSWTLCDAANHCFRFPAGSVLRASGQITIFTGSGQNDGLRFYMGSGRAVWNNNGDTATLYDASGAVVITYRYE